MDTLGWKGSWERECISFLLLLLQIDTNLIAQNPKIYYLTAPEVTSPKIKVLGRAVILRICFPAFSSLAHGLFLHLFFFPFIFISWRLIILQYCSGFCHTLTWISHGFTCIPHPNPPSHPSLYPIPLSLPSAPGPSTCLMHSTWAGDLFHYR